MSGQRTTVSSLAIYVLVTTGCGVSAQGVAARANATRFYDSRLLAPQDGMSDQNTIYVRDPDWVQSRLKTASAFKVFDREVA